MTSKESNNTREKARIYEKIDISSSKRLEEEIMSNPQAIEHSTKLKILNEKIWMLQNQIKNTPDIVIAKKELKSQLRDLNREKNRIIKFYIVIKNPEVYWDLSKNSNIDAISAKDLLKIDLKSKWFLSSAFAFRQSVEANGNIIEEPLDYGKLQLWDDIMIDFWKNNQANRKIWVWDILPSKARIVEVIDNNWKSRIWMRDISWSRIWYYDENARYIPVFNGYKLHIPKNEELKDPKYAKILSGKNIKSAFIDDKELAEVEKSEDQAKLQYIWKLEQFAQAEKYNQITEELSVWIASSSYKDKLEQVIKKAKIMMESWDSKYSKEDLMTVVSRLEKTLEVVGDKNLLWLDIDKYKAAICSHESGWDYFARNDEIWRKKWIVPANWAFWKYQFISGTANDYLKKLWAPTIDPTNEESIQAFLNNPSLQEQVMDLHIVNTVERIIIPRISDNSISISENKDMNYYLALTHIGWPWALKNESAKDWLGTSASKYAMNVAEMARNWIGWRIKTDTKIEFLAKTTPDAFIAAAGTHLWDTYSWWGWRWDNTEKTDCSWLILMSMKQCKVLNDSYDNTAEWLARLTVQKPVSEVQRWDLVFLRDKTWKRKWAITHVEIATGPLTSEWIPKIDASSWAWKVIDNKFQAIDSNKYEIIVWTPTFYS
ncbi:MAG: hypothetical protein ACD_3C00149G0009 [uncultured bacterium (gcode 4)]|uniref:Uncharacterized protein n=1 Tax=uncultured bacterium (gcode 4) TaxID=1234023 RepID=K2FXT2_9BACT|nr:MAG: hypothetical protein ACD_3C00149G0009 [uncultured bacterium (gcode 4)]